MGELLPEQERLWLISEWDPERPPASAACAIAFSGPLDRRRLKNAIDRVASLQDALRLRLDLRAGLPRLRFAPRWPVELPFVDLGGWPVERREAQVRAVLDKEAENPFDLAVQAPLRTALLRLAEDEHVLVAVLHPIAGDARSLELFLEQVLRGYAGLPLPAIPPFEAREPRDPSPEPAVRHLRGAAQHLDLPTDAPRAKKAHGPRALHRVEAREDLLLAAFAVLLARHAGKDDFWLGTVARSRRGAGDAQLIGPFDVPALLRVRLDGDPTVEELLARLDAERALAEAHAGIPLGAVLSVLDPEHALDRRAPCQAAFLPAPEPAVLPELPGLTLSRVRAPRASADAELVLHGAGLLEHDAALFSEERAARLVAQLEVVARAMAERPGARISTLPLLGDAERARIEAFGRGEDAPVPDLLATLDANTAAAPAAIAVELGDARLTYAELDERARRWAAYLSRRGVGPDVVVGVAAERSIEAMAALLGILRAGGACLPLDPAYPPERLRLMIDAARAPLVLASRAAVLPPGAYARAELITPAAGPAHPPLSNDPERLAYVVFTSGSTGRPKGVAMPRRALDNLVAWQVRRSGGAAARTLQLTSPSFDVAMQEVFTTWAAGGTLVLVPEEIKKDLAALVKLISEARITRVFLPFVALQKLAEIAERSRSDFPALEEVITAGEQLLITPALAALFSAHPRATLDNQYGPSETHVVTAHRLEGPPERWPTAPPIGTPIAGARLTIAGAGTRPVPIGVAGELLIGGTPVARGYLGMPEETAARFTNGAYRSGDLARWRPDGEIEFLGRLDRQVKIRGYRVEPGEVEAALMRHPSVKTSAVQPREDATGALALVGYVVLEPPEPSDKELRAFLAERLPEQMIPQTIVRLDALPLTPSGKVDRSSLPPPPPRAGKSPTPPSTDAEARVTRRFEEVLRAGPIGVDDDFFELGGTSLLAVNLFASLERDFEKSLPLRLLLDAPTPKRLAAMLEKGELPEARSSLVVLQRGEAHPPLFCIPGSGGHCFTYRGLAPLLGPEQPVLGLELRGLDGRHAPETTVEQVAKRMLKDVARAETRGPYALAGYSFGGLVALEMAQQLRAAGEEVGLLVLFDTWGPGYPAARSRTGRVRFHLERMFASPRAGLREGARALRDRARWARTRAPAGSIEQRVEVVVEASEAAARAYRPRPYPGRITLFKTRGEPDRLTADFDDPTCGWSKLAAGGLDVIDLPCAHLELFDEHIVPTLARTLAPRLRNLRRQ